MHCREMERLTFLEKRDGKEGTIAFAKQGIISYRRSVLKSRTLYRDKMIESYLCFKKYLSYQSIRS